jgi:hypothetical protein
MGGGLGVGLWIKKYFKGNVILTITNVISKNLPSSGTKWLPIMMYILSPGIAFIILI